MVSGEFHRLEKIWFGGRSDSYQQHFEGWIYSDAVDWLCKQRKRLACLASGALVATFLSYESSILNGAMSLICLLVLRLWKLRKPVSFV